MTAADTTDLDLLVVGSGVAGLSAVVGAAAAAPGLRIGVVSKGALSDSATQWAQGGVAAVLSHAEADVRAPADSVELHVADTLKAGAGLCDPEAVAVLVREGPARVRDLAARGAIFDRNPNGVWQLAREGGHSTARVVHAGGAATGAEVERALVEAARAGAAALWEGWFALDILTEGGRARGVTARAPDGRVVELRATHTVIASGGAGQLFSLTTNPPQSTGDGLAMALRAGVGVVDVEFMQFHPTALHGTTSGPRPLLSEAVRGEGALLRDHRGARFVDELSPRDVVSSAMAERMAAGGVDHLWLDVTALEHFERDFPNLAASVRSLGLDPATDWLPVAPAAHYLCGGIATDLDGATTLPGLWAAGEAAATGVHGANRLASNSLLEGMVFGTRVVEAIIRGKDRPDPTGVLRAVLDPASVPADGIGATPLGHDRPGWLAPTLDPAKGIEQLQRTMSAGAGVLRRAETLTATAADLDTLARPAAAPPAATTACELANLVTVGQRLLAGAVARQESRGFHCRAEHPAPLPSFSLRFIQ